MWREESSHLFHTYFVGMEVYVQIPVAYKELKERNAQQL
jgi:hypothetical protein